MSTFVTVGNAKQPFTRLLDLVRESLADLPGPVFIQHGTADFDLSACACAATISAAAYRQRMAAAALVICHAGAGSLLDAAVLGKPIIALPRERRFGEMVDDHQVELAERFAERQIIIVPKPDETLSAALERLARLPRPDLDRASELVGKVGAAVRQEAALLGFEPGSFN
jgi:UDP-N-acetylglucosamine transferase subunit ALG13